MVSERDALDAWFREFGPFECPICHNPGYDIVGTTPAFESASAEATPVADPEFIRVVCRGEAPHKVAFPWSRFRNQDMILKAQSTARRPRTPGVRITFRRCAVCRGTGTAIKTTPDSRFGVGSEAICVRCAGAGYHWSAGSDIFTYQDVLDGRLP